MINAIIFLVQAIAPARDYLSCAGLSLGQPMDLVTQYLAMWAPTGDTSACFKPYQLFTYMFLHGDFMHLFFNMLTIVFMGPILENFWGAKKFLMFYMICGIGAAVFHMVVSMVMGAHGLMVGASGAIYGVLMGFGMLFPNMEIMLLIPPIPIKAKYLVFVLGGMTFLMDRSGSVAHFAHLGGIIFAFIVIKAWRSQGGSY
jgi:membrane associated rhomboid family serine protease